MEQHVHQSVLLDEVVGALAPRSNGVYVDCTVGLGGHAEAILEASSPGGRLLGIDRDPAAIHRAQVRLSRFSDRVTLVEGHFADVRRHAKQTHHYPADGVVADLGVSSMQLDDPERGFSFKGGGPLDMRMGPSVDQSAASLLRDVDVSSLAFILKEYGEVRGARRIAGAIVNARDAGALETTEELARLVERAVGRRRKGRTHPATETFQAIRIAVNRELEQLDSFLQALEDLLAPGGRAAVISFHSLEDRRVKRAFRGPSPEPVPRGLPIEPVKKQGPFVPLTKKPITPSQQETETNPRSRSAKLRVAERRL